MNNLGNKEIMSKNLKYFIKLHGIDRNKICKDLNIPYNTLTDWINGNVYPRIDKIELLANYFGIQKSDLIEDKPKYSDEQTDKLVVLRKALRNAGFIKPDEPDLSDEELERLLKFYEANKDFIRIQK